jgi:hypothetical protein
MRLFFPLMLMLVAAGCMTRRAANPAATQPVTAVDPQMADKEYWLARRATAEVRGEFEPLWEASEEAAHEFLFRIDRRDQRSGLLTTEPMVSKQWWELWRKDAGTFRDAQEATLSNIRRTIFFQFRKDGENAYTVTPKVVVERQSKVDLEYREEIEGPETYWYALKRDEAMEKKVAEAIRRKMKD